MADLQEQQRQRELNMLQTLLEAANHGDLEAVQKALQDGASVNCQDELGMTPLMSVAFNNRNASVSDVLIKAGSDVNLKDNVGRTPLHWAAWGNTNTEVSDLLIRAGSDINTGDNNGSTPLDVTKDYNNKGVKALIQSYLSGEKVVHQQSKTATIFKQPSVELKQILANDSSYESFDMRVMVVGKFGVGKTTLVKVLVGDNIPKERLPTDGISLLEGRCGLEISSREWIMIDKDEYNAKDVVYNRLLMPPSQKETTEESAVSKSAEQPSEKPIESLSREVDESLKITETQLVTDNISPTSEINVEDEASRPLSPRVRESTPSLMKTKLSKAELRKRLELALKNGTFQMNVGRLIFWDFGGQYVYYTTHQTFMTYRAFFLVVFDGSKDLHAFDPEDELIPGQHGKPTPAVFLQHWVNSILTYCQQIHNSIPRILFVATNKDKIPQEMIEERRTVLFNDVDQLFKEREGRSHLVLEHRIFLNATDKNDPEIESLKKVITDLTFSHPCWGEKMPKAWVPLELEIAELVAEGKQIISLKELDELNKASEVSVLSQKHLKTFLRIQHSLGKLVYFDNPQLRDHVIINPLYLVEVMKSFVTDKHFWPTDQIGMDTFDKMSLQGIIKKKDLFSLWDRKQFSKIFHYKEFIFNMLVHLDILSEQRRYDLATGIRLPVEDYFVPCMVVKINTTDYMERECVPRRAIGLAFVFKGTVVPPALPNRLISACLNIWALKSYKGEKMLFSGLVVLSYDKSHEVVICVKSNMILLFIVHKRSRGLIVPDTATSVRECMQTSLERISDFYQQSIIGKSSSQKLPFNVRHACSELKCFLPKTDVLEHKDLVCVEHGNKYKIDVWYDEKDKDTCSEDCEGLSNDALSKIPSDPELFRLSKQFGHVDMRELAIQLGLTSQDWDDITQNHPRNIKIVKFLILVQWRNSNSGKFKDVAKALIDKGMDTHRLCQVRRIKRTEKEKGIPEEYLGSIPTDELLDSLASEIGMLSFPLGIELGLTVFQLEVIQDNYKSDLVRQTRKLLQTWRNEPNIKATLCVLQQALVNVGRGTQCLKDIIQQIGVKEHKCPYSDKHPEKDDAKEIVSADGGEESPEAKYQLELSVGGAEQSETTRTGVKPQTIKLPPKEPVEHPEDIDISDAPEPVVQSSVRPQTIKLPPKEPVEHTEDFDILDGPEPVVQSVVGKQNKIQDLPKEKSETLQSGSIMPRRSTRKRKTTAVLAAHQASKRSVFSSTATVTAPTTTALSITLPSVTMPTTTIPTTYTSAVTHSVLNTISASEPDIIHPPATVAGYTPMVSTITTVVGPAHGMPQDVPPNSGITDNQTAIRTAFNLQTTMKDILKMNKEQLKKELRTKKDTIDLLQRHGPMDTKTADDMKLTLLTTAVYEFDRL